MVGTFQQRWIRGGRIQDRTIHQQLDVDHHRAELGNRHLLQRDRSHERYGVLLPCHAHHVERAQQLGRDDGASAQHRDGTDGLWGRGRCERSGLTLVGGSDQQRRKHRHELRGAALDRRHHVDRRRPSERIVDQRRWPHSGNQLLVPSRRGHRGWHGCILVDHRHPGDGAGSTTGLARHHRRHGHDDTLVERTNE